MNSVFKRSVSLALAALLTLCLFQSASPMQVSAATSNEIRTWTMINSGYKVFDNSESSSAFTKNSYIGKDSAGYTWFKEERKEWDAYDYDYHYEQYVGVQDPPKTFTEPGKLTVNAKMYTQNSRSNRVSGEIELGSSGIQCKPGNPCEQRERFMGFFAKGIYSPSKDGELNQTGSASADINNQYLDNGYKFKLEVNCAGGMIWYEYQLNVTKGSATSTKIKAPTQVKKLKAKKTSAGYQVSWTKISKNCKGYVMNVSTKKTFPTTSTNANKGGTVTLYATKNKLKLKGFIKGKTYYVRVRAYNKSGNTEKLGKWSKTLKFKAK